MSKEPLHILQVNTSDIGGGAEKVSWDLCRAFGERGLDSWLAVGFKRSGDSNVVEIPRPRSTWAGLNRTLSERLAPLQGRLRGIGGLRYLLRILGGGWPALEGELGRERFNFPGSHRLLQLLPRRPSIVHCHNLHGDYFDLRILPSLSRQVPIVLTLHDAWLLTGHCAHSFDCERWKIGCGVCPDLTIPPAIKRDRTAFNLRRKRDIYVQSRVYLATPSKWLMEKVSESMLERAVEDRRIIPNGVALSVFQPADRRQARTDLGLPQDAKLLLSTGNGIRTNIWKDYRTLQGTIARITDRLPNQRILFIAVGDDAASVRTDRLEVRFVPYQRDPQIVARYYQAADVYLHAARAENFPISVLEALACGTPVVATAVGGIPEQVKALRPADYGLHQSLDTYSLDEVTGILVPVGNVEAMTAATMVLLTDDSLRLKLGQNAARDARLRFGLNRQVEAYLAWYQEIIEHRTVENGATTGP